MSLKLIKNEESKNKKPHENAEKLITKHMLQHTQLHSTLSLSFSFSFKIHKNTYTRTHMYTSYQCHHIETPARGFREWKTSFQLIKLISIVLKAADVE